MCRVCKKQGKHRTPRQRSRLLYLIQSEIQARSTFCFNSFFDFCGFPLVLGFEFCLCFLIFFIFFVFRALDPWKFCRVEFIFLGFLRFPLSSSELNFLLPLAEAWANFSFFVAPASGLELFFAAAVLFLSRCAVESRKEQQKKTLQDQQNVEVQMVMLPQQTSAGTTCWGVNKCQDQIFTGGVFSHSRNGVKT